METRKPLIQILGPRIRELRVAQGLSQGELARRARIDRADLSRLETSTGPRNFGIERLEQLANGLGVAPADLLTESRRRRHGRSMRRRRAVA